MAGNAAGEPDGGAAGGVAGAGVALIAVAMLVFYVQVMGSGVALRYLNDALRQIVNNGASLAAVQIDLLILAA